MEFVSKDLQEYPPLWFPKVKEGEEMVSYARIFSYNYSKYLGQRLLEMISEQDKKDIRILMISDVYGPGQSINSNILTTQGGLRRPQVFLAVYKAIVEGHQEWIPDIKEKPAHGFNQNSSIHQITQNVWRDYVAPTYVGDVSRMILHVSSISQTDLPKNKVVFNVSAPPISNIDFARKLKGLLHTSVKVKTSGEKLFSRPQGQDADLKMLGIELTSLEDGVSQWITKEEGDKAMLSDVETSLKYPNAGINKDRQEEAPTVFINLDSRIQLSFQMWKERDAKPFTEEELRIFETSAVKHKMDLAPDEIISIRHSASDRSSGKMKIRAIAVDNKDNTHYYELSGKNTTELMETLEPVLPNFRNMKDPKAIFQITTGNQADLLGNFTVISDGKNWKLFGSTNEQWQGKNHRAFVEFKNGVRVAGSIRFEGDLGTNSIQKVFLKRGIESDAPSIEIEINPGDTKFIMVAYTLGWGSLDPKMLLRENYTKTSDFRHLFRIPYKNGSIFYQQLVREEVLDRAFTGQVVKFNLNDGTQTFTQEELIPLMEQNGYVLRNQLDEVTISGDFYMTKEFLYLILLPAKYPLSTLVMSEDGQHVAFISVQGQSGRLGANYWTFYEWVRQQIQRRFGWIPKAVFALDNGADPYIKEFDSEGKEGVLVQGGRENYYAALSIIPRQDNAVSSDVGGIDLNPNILDLKVQKNGFGFQQLNFSQDIGKNIHINGLLPVIINVTPIDDVLLLLCSSVDKNNLSMIN